MNVFYTIAIVILVGIKAFAQPVLPVKLTLTQLMYKTAEGKTEPYNFTNSEKKAFLFFDIKSEPLAEVMYNGSAFVFNNTPISVFPIFFTGQLIKKNSKNFPSKIPTQLVKSPLKSDFKALNLNESDFPLLIVYNEKNELCGYAKTTEQIAEINCPVQPTDLKQLKLKILTEEKEGLPLPYAFKPIILIGGNLKDTIAKVSTNQYGDFDASLPNLNQDYVVTVNEKNENIKFIILSTQSGKKIGNFTATDKGFQYRILQLDLMKLPDIYVEEDIALKLKATETKGVSDFVITENLFYESGSTSLSNESKQLLTKMVAVMEKYTEFKITVISHTDAQGDDNANLNLSIKRSQEVINYLSEKGIAKPRLIAVGKGEKEIRNRCVNNIDCSKKEHEYNRRTEFKFSKK